VVPWLINRTVRFEPRSIWYHIFFTTSVMLSFTSWVPPSVHVLYFKNPSTLSLPNIITSVIQHYLQEKAQYLCRICFALPNLNSPSLSGLLFASGLGNTCTPNVVLVTPLHCQVAWCFTELVHVGNVVAYHVLFITSYSSINIPEFL
jgi:hypothetical protein